MKIMKTSGIKNHFDRHSRHFQICQSLPVLVRFLPIDKPIIPFGLDFVDSKVSIVMVCMKILQIWFETTKVSITKTLYGW